MNLSVVSTILREGYGIPLPDVPAQSSTESTDAETQQAYTPDTLTTLGRMAGHAAGGGFAAYKLGGQTATHIREATEAYKGTPEAPGGIKAALPGIQKVMFNGLKGAGLSALVSAGVSAVTNGVGVVSGKTDSQTAFNNVVGDTISGAVGGFTGVTAAGAGNLLLSSMGMAGIPLTIGTVAFGAVGGILGGKLVSGMQQAGATTTE